MVHCKIHLENNDRAVYYAGDMLKGTIELHLDQPKKFRGMYFKVYGAAKCHWTETQRRTTGTGSNRRTHTHTIHFEGKNVYINTKTYLFGHDGATPVEMPSGTHRYNFALQLPPLLPASFEASHGHIRYEVEAALDVPWGFDKEFKLQFTIVRNDDLNYDPQLKMPVQMEDITTFCCLFCQSAPLMMTVSVPCTGFAAGQNIPININYVNKSDVDASSTKINLKRIIRFNSETPHHKTKLQEEKMAEIFIDGAKAASSISFQKNLQIPHVMLASNSRFCNVVQITYELKIEAITSGCGSNPTIKIPIIIGTVPINLEQTVTNFPAVTPYVDNGFNPSAPAAPASDLPPSFEEATKMDSKQVEANGYQQPSGVGWNIAQMPSAPSDK